MGWQPTWAKRPGRAVAAESPPSCVIEHEPRGRLARTSWGTVCVSDPAEPSIELFGPSPEPVPLTFRSSDEKPSPAVDRKEPRPQTRQVSLFSERPRSACKRPPRKAVA